MQLNFGLFLLFAGCVIVSVKGQGASTNCGEEDVHGQMSIAECELEYDGLGACLQPGSCANEECQKKCYLCNCPEKVQCMVRGTGANEEVYCNCSRGNSGTGHGPLCQSECDEDGDCTGEHRVCEDYNCVCEEGYEEDEDDSNEDCIEITTPPPPDCTGDDECGDHASCMDGTCDCDEGYDGDGYTCTDINECIETTNGGCGEDAICINTDGSHICACLDPGYEWDGSDCVDIDECANNNGNCNNARCINTEGSHVCMCPCGQSWNGAFCTTPCGGGGGDGSCGGPACYPIYP